MATKVVFFCTTAPPESVPPARGTQDLEDSIYFYFNEASYKIKLQEKPDGTGVHSFPWELTLCIDLSEEELSTFYFLRGLPPLSVTGKLLLRQTETRRFM